MKKKRKHNPARQAAAAVPAGALQPEPCVSVKTLREEILARIERQDWDSLSEFSNRTLQGVVESERAEAERLMLSARFIALRAAAEEWYGLPKESREQLADIMLQLARRVRDGFYEWYGFRDFIRHHPVTVESSALAYQHLLAACREAPTPEWLLALRTKAHSLAHLDSNEAVPEGAVAQALGCSLDEMWAALDAIYATALASGRMDERGRVLTRIVQLDRAVGKAEPSDLLALADAIRQLPAPSPGEGPAPRGNLMSDGFTPQAWAFAIECGMGGGRIPLETIVSRYPEPFHHPAYEAVRLVAMSLADVGDIDANLTQALRLLFPVGEPPCTRAGLGLLLSDAVGEFEFSFGYGAPLTAPAPADLMIRFFEASSPRHRRHAEIQALARIYSANCDGGWLDDESDSDDKMPGLAELCRWHLPCKFVAANVVEGLDARLRLFLGALAETASTKTEPPADYGFWGLGGEEDKLRLKPAEIPSVLAALEPLAAVRSQLPPDAESLWQDNVGDIFRLLTAACPQTAAIPQKLQQLTRAFLADLLEAGEALLAGYIEELAGDAVAALDHYLSSLPSLTSADAAREAKRMRGLWASCLTRTTVQQMVALLKGAKHTLHPKLIQELATDAERHLDALEKQYQFQQTAVNRWPSLTAPARKLLGVLATIKRFNSFRELGEYAGMDEAWVDRHYRKLVETGMLQDNGEGRYSINPVIAPLLERESQHAVVGRIVRATGTSAVKQVFNSQREFSIYLIVVQLCPNHLVFPNCALQSIMSYDQMKELVDADDFGYYLRASVDIVVVSSTSYLPMLAIEVDSVWHDTERQQRNDDRKDRLFATAGIPFMRLRPVGSPSENAIRAQVAEHLDELVRTLRQDLPGYTQTRGLLETLAGDTKAD